MSTSIVDGSVAEAVLKRTRAGVSIFDHIRFDLSDGSSRTIKKAVTTEEIGSALVPGAKGRFYLFASFDLKGVHGIRLTDGRSAYGFPGANNQKIFIILSLVNLAWVILRFAVDSKIPFLGVGLCILGLVGFFLTRKGKLEAEQQYAADAAYAVAPGGAAPAGAA